MNEPIDVEEHSRTAHPWLEENLEPRRPNVVPSIRGIDHQRSEASPSNVCSNRVRRQVGPTIRPPCMRPGSFRCPNVG